MLEILIINKEVIKLYDFPKKQQSGRQEGDWRAG